MNNNGNSSMKIEIEAIDLLGILVEAGIGDNDAKSLVFDILARQSGVPMNRNQAQAQASQRQSQQPTRQPVRMQAQPVQQPEQYEDDLDEVQQPEERTSVTRTRVSYNSNSQSSSGDKPINFSNFGGTFNGMGNKR